MGDVYRSRYYSERDRDDDGSTDEERVKTTTVRRYKVAAPSRYERSDRLDVEDDRRSRVSSHAPDRPRSAFEPYGDRSRTAVYERDVERDSYRDPDRSRITVYESKESDRDWDKRSRYHGRDDEVRVEKRTEEHFDDHGHDVERYRKETEYYAQADPGPRQRQEPQRIIIQQAPQPAPIIVPRQDPGVIVVRDKESNRENREVARRDRNDDDYFYRHERREVDRYGGRHEEGVMAVGRPRNRHRDDENNEDEDDYYRRTTVVRRERSESPRHHVRKLAEGAIAGAGLTALLQSRRDQSGDLPQNRGRKVLAGAALGALGSEAFKRAHSAYEDRYGDDDKSPDRHSMLKKGLGIAAVALAAAGAAKYYQSGKIEKEEAARGRSRHKYYSDDEYSQSRSRSRTKSRARSKRRSMSTVAKAAVGTAAVAGIVKHLHDRSKSRKGSKSRSRSKSMLRRGAQLAGAAAAAGVATKLWKNHKDKQERDRSMGSDEGVPLSRSPSRSPSGSRPGARSFHSDDGADLEQGLVEYGNNPLPPRGRYSGAAYEDEAEERRRRNRRRDRSMSESGSEEPRQRSGSRLRDMAAAGAAAFGIKEYKDRKDQDKKDKRARDRRRREDESPYDERPSSPPMASGGYYPPYPSTPGASQAYPQYPEAPGQDYQQYAPQDYTGYPPPPPPGPPHTPGGGAATGFPPAPPGPPPPGGNVPPNHVSDNARSQKAAMVREDDDGVMSVTDRAPSSSASQNHATLSAEPPLGPPKSVSFLPLSPQSSRTIERHKREHQEHEDGEASQAGHFPEEYPAEGNTTGKRPSARRQRGSSDPSSDRPIIQRRRTGHAALVSDEDDEVEDLPDRFDSQGRQLDGEAVAGLVRNMTGVLEGRGTWSGLLGQAIQGGLLGGQATGRQDDEDEDEGDRRGTRRKRR